MKSLIKAAHVDPNFPFGDRGPYFIRRPPAQRVCTLRVREPTPSDVFVIARGRAEKAKKIERKEALGISLAGMNSTPCCSIWMAGRGGSLLKD